MMSKALVIGLLLGGIFATVYGAISIDLHRKMKTSDLNFKSNCGVSGKEVKALYVMGILTILGGIFAIIVSAWLLLPKGHKNKLRGLAGRFVGYGSE